MATKIHRLAVLGGIAGLTLLAGGCANGNGPPPPAHPGPYRTPVDALNATSVPYDPSASQGADQPLSQDLSQLRDARANYEHSQAVLQAQQRDQQARCRQQPNAHLVRIQDGSGDPDAVYCQSTPTDSDSDNSGGNDGGG